MSPNKITNSFLGQRPFKKFLTVLSLLLIGVNAWGQTSYTSTSATSAWNAARWNNSSDASPYTSAFTANNAVNFTSGTYTFAGMGASTNVGNVTVANNVTVSFAAAGSTFATNGAVRTFDIGSGGLFDFNGQAISTAAGTGFVKTGAGVFALAGGTFTGGFTLNAGTVIARGTTGLGGGTGNILTLNGGTIASNGNISFANTRFPGGIVIGGNIQFGEITSNVALANSTANLQFDNSVSLGGSLRTLTLGNGGTQTLTGVISNTGSNGLTFTANSNGTGRFDITGTNTFTGPVNINGNGTGVAEVRFTSDASIGNSTNTITIDGGRFGIVSSASVTIANARNIAVGSTTGTSIIAPGSTFTLTYNGVIADKSGSTGILSKQGAGTLSLGGVSTYTGATSINSGTLQLTTGNDRLSTSTVLSLGQAASANLGTLDLNGRNQTIGGLNTTTGTATSGNNTITSGAAATLTINSSTSNSYGSTTPANPGTIGGAISIVKSGIGTQTFGGAANYTYTGTTTITAGKIELANANVIPSTELILNGGTFSTGASAGFTETVGTLNLNTTGTIALGTGVHTLTFANSSAVTWAGTTLNITGWTGTAGASGTAGKIFIGSDTTGLTGGQLAKISFSGYAGIATILSTGEVVPLALPAITTTLTPTSITHNTVSSGGQTISGSNITSKGVVWNTSTAPTVALSTITNDGTGTTDFSSSLTSLASETLYYIRAYATNASGTGYGDEKSFRTLSAPASVQASSLSATASSPSNIDLTWTGATFPSSGATAQGYVLLRATSPNTPTLGNSNGASPTAGSNTIMVSSTISSSANSFSSSGLAPSTQYNYLIIPFTWDGTNASTYNYLTTSAPTANATTQYGSTAPVLVTNTSTSITDVTATFNGDVTNDGGSAITERGFVYSISDATPTIGEAGVTQQTVSGTTGVFSYNASGLSVYTVYYTQAYATNSTGTTYGGVDQFTTLKSEPSVQATSLVFSAITSSSFNTAFTASVGSPDGYIVLSSTSSSLSLNPIDGTTYTAGNSLGGGTVISVGSSLSGIANTSLSSGTTYYIFVYAYNNSGSNINYLSTSPLSASAITLTAAPASPTFSSVNTTSFTIDWTATSGANSYRLDLSTVSNFSSFISGYQDLTVSSTSQAVSGLTENTLYYARIRAENASGTSANSSSGNSPTLSNPPTISTASSITTSNLTGNWTAPASQGSVATTYAIELSLLSNDFSSPVAAAASISSSLTTYQFTGLSDGTTYYYRVKAVNSAGSSAWSSVSAGATTLPGSISLTALGTASTEDFNTLVSSLSSSALPFGWYLSESGSNANSIYTAGTGSSNSGDTYSFGTSSDRAFGGLQSSNLIPTIGAKFKNNSGSTINNLFISYTGETWRVGSASRVDQLDFQYSTDATSLTSGNWIDVNILDYANPGQTVGSGSLQHSSSISDVITGLSIANGASFIIRWLDFDVVSLADDGMGIDDFSIKPCGTTSAPTAANQSFCSSTSPTVSNLTATGTSIQWYAASSGGSALATNTTLVNNTTYYASQTAGGCESVTRASSTITLSSNTASAASSSPTLCINAALTNITHTTTGATGIGTATGLPAGVTAAWASNTITISGTPTASGNFSYSIPLSGGCGSVNATGTIIVSADNTVGVASSSPTLIINTPLTAITHTSTGATGIGTATGLPAGVTAAWASNTITISGTPTASGNFSYSIPLSGGCGSVNATGSINVSADNTVGAASSSPTLCINAALTNITHTTTGATGIGTATGLPAGVTAAWASNTITISGTPTASGNFSYSIPLSGGSGSVNATGSINVSANNTVGAASSSPTLSINTALTNITHTTTGATGIGTATGLPAGVTAAWASNTITISGTPTASGNFSYSIPLTGGCSSLNATGSINVSADNTVGAASSSPTLCINAALTNITHTTTGATGIGAATGLPAGVTAAWASNTITISGTPTASGAFSYSIPLSGGSGSVNATGTINVSADNTASAASSSPTLSINTALTNITHTTTGATGIGTATGLPAGVTAAWASNTITISGTPTASGNFSYSIPLTGGCSSLNASGTINVSVNNTVGAASSSPTLCINAALTNITHTTTGATGIGTATGLPAGVTAAWASNTITISGTPTASGNFSYSIPLIGGSGSVNATGTINVSADNTASAASSSPTLSINTALTNITHTTTGATGIGTATGLPAGVTAAWASNTITISGTPTASGAFSYSIPLSGVCGSVNATGTINVVASCPTDLNNDGVTDVNDFIIFAPEFGNTNVVASPTDLNNDGVTDVNDFIIFAPAFNVVCQ